MPQAKTLTPAELERVLTYIDSKPNALRNRVALLLTVWAGFRVGEVAGLTIADVRNADGSYTYSGRSDDMLKVSGIYVSPFEVEGSLMTHPAVL